jgi:hypothetical protein
MYIILFGVIFGQIMTVHPPNGARAAVMIPSYYMLSGLLWNKIYIYSKQSKLVLFVIISAAVLFSLLDFLFYKDWMLWIKV